MPPAETACSLEIRPQQYKDQCDATKLESRSRCFPFILHDKSSSSKTDYGKSGTSENSKPSVVYPTLICLTALHVSVKPTHVTK